MRYKMAMACVMLFTTLAFAADVRITDQSGKTNVVKGVRIDYTNYPGVGVYSEDFESGGMRIRDGDATITVSWSKIDGVVIKQQDATTQPSRIAAEMSMKDGTKKNILLDMDSKKGVFGEADAGEYSIRLQKIKSIEVVKP